VICPIRMAIVLFSESVMERFAMMPSQNSIISCLFMGLYMAWQPVHFGEWTARRILARTPHFVYIGIMEHMEPKINIIAFFKFNPLIHLEDLRDNGTVYMNTLRYFRDQEQNAQKRDPSEGTKEIKQGDNFRFTVHGETYEVTNENQHVVQMRISDKNLRGNIYSLTAFTEQMLEHTDTLDLQNAGLGDHFLWINNPALFMQRVEQALKDREINYRIGPVRYYDETTENGKLDVFDKPLQGYQHQNEFRIFADYDKDEALKLKIEPMPEFMHIFNIAKLGRATFEKRS